MIQLIQQKKRILKGDKFLITGSVTDTLFREHQLFHYNYLYVYCNILLEIHLEILILLKRLANYFLIYKKTAQVYVPLKRDALPVCLPKTKWYERTVSIRLPGTRFHIPDPQTAYDFSGVLTRSAVSLEWKSNKANEYSFNVYLKEIKKRISTSLKIPPRSGSVW